MGLKSHCFDIVGRNRCLYRVRYKVTVFPRSKKIKLPFLKVTVSESYRFFQVESYRCPKVTVFLGIKLPFIVIKLPHLTAAKITDDAGC